MQCMSNPADGKPDAGWRKSRRSFANGNCVEVGWRKARRSMSNGNCAEAASSGGTVLVRDTADRDGTVLSFPAKAWAAFTAAVEK